MGPLLALLPLSLLLGCPGGGSPAGAYDRCICDYTVTDDIALCEQLDRKAGDDRDLSPFCDGPTAQGCEASGGTYLTDGTECPTDDLVGVCFDDEADDADKPFTKSTHYYALGSQPFDAASAEADCEDDEVFQSP